MKITPIILLFGPSGWAIVINFRFFCVNWVDTCHVELWSSKRFIQIKVSTVSGENVLFTNLQRYNFPYRKYSKDRKSSFIPVVRSFTSIPKFFNLMISLAPNNYFTHLLYSQEHYLKTRTNAFVLVVISIIFFCFIIKMLV